MISLYKISTDYGIVIGAEKTKLMSNKKYGFTDDNQVKDLKLEAVTSFEYIGVLNHIQRINSTSPL